MSEGEKKGEKDVVIERNRTHEHFLKMRIYKLITIVERKGK